MGDIDLYIYPKKIAICSLWTVLVLSIDHYKANTNAQSMCCIIFGTLSILTFCTEHDDNFSAEDNLNDFTGILN